MSLFRNFDGLEEFLLVKDMLEYQPDKQLRARIAYNNCRKMGHMKWAKEIDRKYRISRVIYSDMAKIYVGFSFGGGIVAATTKIGLGRLVGVSVDTVRRALDESGNQRLAPAVQKDGKSMIWYIAEVELVKVDRQETRSAGFLGFKGSDGMLRELYKGVEKTKTPKGFKAIKI